jgi:hypothetical protein
LGKLNPTMFFGHLFSRRDVAPLCGVDINARITIKPFLGAVGFRLPQGFGASLLGRNVVLLSARRGRAHWGALQHLDACKKRVQLQGNGLRPESTPERRDGSHQGRNAHSRARFNIYSCWDCRSKHERRADASGVRTHVGFSRVRRMTQQSKNNRQSGGRVYYGK